jgi:hypothetical protein
MHPDLAESHIHSFVGNPRTDLDEHRATLKRYEIE